MRRILIFVVVLGLSVWAAGQAAPSGQSAAPQGKRPPQAKTQDEFQAYKATMALTDAAAQEKAADDFAAKFPNSELKALVYKQGPMHGYQSAHNDDKTVRWRARF